MNRLIWLFLIVTRLRDRLHCPHCKAVGTYKLHAPTPRWRWLCKWCGYYRDHEKEGMLCYPSPSKKCWVFYDDHHPEQEHVVGYHRILAIKVPRDLMDDYNELAECDIWPWRG